nr:uncharacterized protein LOC111428011 [Onthophagus taurus]
MGINNRKMNVKTFKMIMFLVTLTFLQLNVEAQLVDKCLPIYEIKFYNGSSANIMAVQLKQEYLSVSQAQTIWDNKNNETFYLENFLNNSITVNVTDISTKPGNLFSSIQTDHSHEECSGIQVSVNTILEPPFCIILIKDKTNGTILPLNVTTIVDKDFIYANYTGGAIPLGTPIACHNDSFGGLLINETNNQFLFQILKEDSSTTGVVGAAPKLLSMSVITVVLAYLSLNI